MEKRKQFERLLIATSILAEIWSEISNGQHNEDILQEAVYAQIYCNRIVWKLNELKNRSKKDE